MVLVPLASVGGELVVGEVAAHLSEHAVLLRETAPRQESPCSLKVVWPAAKQEHVHPSNGMLVERKRWVGGVNERQTKPSL